MKISYRFAPNGSRQDYALTIDGAEIGRVKDKEHAQLIEDQSLTIANLQKRIDNIIKENDELTATNQIQANELRKRNNGPK